LALSDEDTLLASATAKDVVVMDATDITDAVIFGTEVVTTDGILVTDAVTSAMDVMATRLDVAFVADAVVTATDEITQPASLTSRVAHFSTSSCETQH